MNLILKCHAVTFVVFSRISELNQRCLIILVRHYFTFVLLLIKLTLYITESRHFKFKSLYTGFKRSHLVISIFLTIEKNETANKLQKRLLYIHFMNILGS